MSWLNRIQRWRKQRLLRHDRIPLRLWETVVKDVLQHYQLDSHELHRLRELASLFLHHKVINGAGEFEVDAYMRAVIAAEACLLILNLEFDYYDGWLEVIVYPGSFIVTRERSDEAGVVHEQYALLDGESWSHGPVILAWQDVQAHGSGSSVILHEFAHKLDMLNGVANGMPPLHPAMDRDRWTQIFTAAYRSLQQQLTHHHQTAINPYGAESPAEFFAVVTEAFFESPVRLQHWQPDVYGQLSLFYRQEPLKRFT